MPVIELSPRFPRLRTRLVWAVTLLGFATISAWLCREPPTPPPPKLKVVYVGEEMTREGYSAGSALGGMAIQLPAHNDARMFRVDPTDRMGMFDPGGTVDYFLEDPWMRVGCGRGPLSINFAPNGVAPDVFVVDGNLWIDSHRAVFFMMSANGTPVTIVVHGDVHIADNVIMRDGSLKIIALKRSNDEGGAIYLDDPTFSTPPRRVDVKLAAEAGVHVQPESMVGDVLSVVDAMPKY
jgi:hypothetical protein